MSDQVFVSVTGAAAGILLLWLWLRDLRSNRVAESGETKQALPGAFPATIGTCVIASVGAIVIVLGISVVERVAGIEDQQSRIPYYYLLAMLGAAVTEEIIFRGYLIVRNKGRLMLVISACFFSLVFAAMHPYLWQHNIEAPSGIEWVTSLRLRFSTYAGISTASIAILSLWYYYVRFFAKNPSNSLLPCFCAHACANLSVFIMKLVTGYVTMH